MICCAHLPIETRLNFVSNLKRHFSAVFLFLRNQLSRPSADAITGEGLIVNTRLRTVVHDLSVCQPELFKTAFPVIFRYPFPGACQSLTEPAARPDTRFSLWFGESHAPWSTQSCKLCRAACFARSCPSPIAVGRMQCKKSSGHRLNF